MNSTIRGFLTRAQLHLSPPRNSLIKEYEREARTDGIPAAELQNKKRWMVNELNRFIALKKQLTQQLESRQNLFQG